MSLLRAVALASCAWFAPSVAVAQEALEPCSLRPLGTLGVVWDNNRPFVQVRANGQRPFALVDTGADLTVLFASGAERLGLETRRLRSVGFRGVGGVASLGVARVPDFAIVGDRTRDIDIGVVGTNWRGRADVVMVLGQDVLALSDVEFDFANAAVRRFRPQGDCQGVGLAYWGEYLEVPMARRRGGDTTIVVNVQLNGRDAAALMDTGAPISMASLDIARATGVALEETGPDLGGAGARRLQSWLTRFDSFALGGETIRNARLRVADFGRRDGLAGIDMILGADFFRTHRVFVSYSQRRIYFSYVGGRVFQVVGDIALTGDTPGAPPLEEPTNAEGYVNRGNSRFVNEDFPGAIADFERAIALNAELPDAYVGRAEVLLELGDTSRALDALDEAARLSPNDPVLENLRCWERALVGVELDVARAACDAALAVSPGSSAILDSRGLVSLKQQRYAEAWADYDAALREQPDWPHFLYGRGVAALRLGRLSEGQADIARALELDPVVGADYEEYGVRID